MRRLRIALLSMILLFGFSSLGIKASETEGNLFPPTITTRTYNGVTITRGIDNNYTMNGTATSSMYVSFLDDNAIAYTSWTEALAGGSIITLVDTEPYCANYWYVSGSTTFSGYFRVSPTADNDFKIQDLSQTNSVCDNAVGTLAKGVMYIASGDSFTNLEFNYSFTKTLTPPTEYQPYTYVPPSPTDTVASLLTLISAWLSGIWVFVASSVSASVLIFFDGTNITTIGVLSLFGLSFSLVLFGLAFVSRLIKK